MNKTSKSPTELSLVALKKLAGTPAHLGIRWLLQTGYVEEIQTPRGKPRRYKLVQSIPPVFEINEHLRKQHTTTVESLVADAFAGFEELKDELQEWFDNLPENFQSGDKGEELQQAIDTLESLSEPEVPESLRDVEVVFFPGEDVESRRDRCGECCRMLEAAKDALDQLDTEKADEAEETEGVEEDGYDADEIKALVDELENAAGEAESVEFPGR